MALLDLIITHYKEPWEDGRKMFEMLRLQRGVSPGEFRVILVQDGEDHPLDLRRIMKVYPFVEQVAVLPHGGVSRARNHGLALAESKWVMFCDFDDMLYTSDSMFRILESLREAGDRGDLVYSDFWMEVRMPDGKFGKVIKERNRVFVHGKCWRREFLLDHRLHFEPDLTYSEDALFCETADLEMDPARVARMPEVTYVWCYRPESLSNYTGGDGARNLSLYRKRLKLIDAYMERGMEYDAKCAAVRMLLEYYWDLNGKTELPGGTREEGTQRVQEDVIRRFPTAVYDISPYDRDRIRRILDKSAEQQRIKREGMMPMGQWLAEVGAIRPEDAERCLMPKERKENENDCRDL